MLASVLIIKRLHSYIFSMSTVDWSWHGHPLLLFLFVQPESMNIHGQKMVSLGFVIMLLCVRPLGQANWSTDCARCSCYYSLPPLYRNGSLFKKMHLPSDIWHSEFPDWHRSVHTLCSRSWGNHFIFKSDSVVDLICWENITSTVSFLAYLGRFVSRFLKVNKNFQT